MPSRRAHIASAFEFAVPLVFALLVLQTTTDRIGSAEAGLILLLVTLSAFAVNLDITGGRTLAGAFTRLAPESVPAFIRTGFIWVFPVGGLVGGASLGLGIFVVGQSPEPAVSVQTVTLLLFATSCILAQASTYLLWCRLGLGDLAARSASVAVGNGVGIFAVWMLQMIQASHQWQFAIPFIARDASLLTLNSVWLQSRYGIVGKISLQSWLHHLPIVGKAVILSFVTGLFEPLIKVYLASSISLSQIPTYELAHRAMAAARNATVVFAQSYTRSFLSGNGRQPSLVAKVETLTTGGLFTTLSLGSLALILFSGPIARASPSEVLLYFAPIIPSLLLQGAIIPRYLILFAEGKVWTLSGSHLIQSIPALIMIAWPGPHSQLHIVLALSLSYTVGALTITQATRGISSSFSLSLRGNAAALAITSVATVLLAAAVSRLPIWALPAVFIACSVALAPLLVRTYRESLSVSK